MLVVDPPITVRHSSSCATTLEVKPRATALGNVTVRGRIFVMGHDIAAMSRDIKLNKMQHTVAKLRELVVSYVAYPELLQEGGGYLGFRAPKKRSLKARF